MRFRMIFTVLVLLALTTLALPLPRTSVPSRLGEDASVQFYYLGPYGQTGNRALTYNACFGISPILDGEAEVEVWVVDSPDYYIGGFLLNGQAYHMGPGYFNGTDSIVTGPAGEYWYLVVTYGGITYTSVPRGPIESGTQADTLVQEDWSCDAGCEPVEIGEHFCLNFEPDQTIDVCWCCPQEGPPVFTWVPGCHPGQTDCHDPHCDDATGQLFWTDAVFVPSDSCGELGGHWTATFSLESEEDFGCVCVSFDEQLPVELTAAPVLIPGDRQLTLSFNVADEHDVTSYTIMRDGAKVAELESVDGAYVYVDANLMNGRRYEYTIVAMELGLRNVLSYDGNTIWSATPSANAVLVTEYSLHQNYPNPFNPTTTLSFDLMESGFASLKVYNLIGQEVVTVISGVMERGRHVAVFDASDLPSGVYIYRLEAGDFVEQKKMMLMK